MKNTSLVLNRMYLLCFVAVLTSCASKQDVSIVKSDKDVFVSGDEIVYIGEITKEKNFEVFDFFNKNNIKKINISSVGGDVFAGIELGTWINNNSLDVKVDLICASSCANYVFLAGNNKYLNDKASLIWHGSSYQPDMDKLFKSGDEFAIKWRTKEEDFYKKIKVSHAITVCGFNQVPTWDTILDALNLNKVRGFYYSVNDLEQFGVSNIHLSPSDTNINKAGFFEANYCNYSN